MHSQAVLSVILIFFMSIDMTSLNAVSFVNGDRLLLLDIFRKFCLNMGMLYGLLPVDMDPKFILMYNTFYFHIKIQRYIRSLQQTVFQTKSPHWFHQMGYLYSIFPKLSEVYRRCQYYIPGSQQELAPRSDLILYEVTRKLPEFVYHFNQSD